MIVAWKPLLAASTAAASALFAAVLDCNPKLFLYDRIVYDPVNSYRGKSVWIVGSSSGIGNEMALQLARLKCKRLILSSRNEQALEKLKHQCQEVQSTCDCICIPMDVTDQKRMSDAVDLVHEKCPSLDMVFLNAGAGQLSPGLETNPEVVQGIMQTNAIWPMIFLPMLLNKTNNASSMQQQSPKRPSSTETSVPRIIVTSSIAALIPVPLSTAYAAAKAAVQQYFLSIATERPDLTIDIICPGPIDTNFHSNHIGKKEGEHDPSKIDQATEGQSSAKTSPLKMPVERCAHLMLATAAMSHSSGGVSESWIVKQPTLTALYLNQWVPGLLRPLLGKVGTRRVQMWRDGLDLYDPKLWSKGISQQTKRE